MIFDPFGDFEDQGYLRNILGSKDIQEVRTLEYASFQRNLDRAANALAKINFIEYKHVLAIHKTLFGAVYPWAGQDRSITAPGINIAKAGYNSMFAQSQYVRRVTEYALDQGRDLGVIRKQP
jgi:cell filamentation protein